MTKTKAEIKKVLESEKEKARWAWKTGVILYAIDILDSIDDEEITEKNLLNGARNWKEYSEGGCALIYDVDICNRLCTPPGIKRTKNGRRRPNRQETWIDVQAHALYQAARLIIEINNKMMEDMK